MRDPVIFLHLASCYVGPAIHKTYILHPFRDHLTSYSAGNSSFDLWLFENKVFTEIPIVDVIARMLQVGGKVHPHIIPDRLGTSAEGIIF